MEHTNRKGRIKINDRLITIILLCVFLVGICILVYPTVSNWWNDRVSTQAIATYDETVAQMSETDYSEYFEAAQAFNESLVSIGSAFTITDSTLVDEDYWELLDITGTGIMGYITIDKIDVRLSIYHGTDAGVLQVGAGHLEGTSLPVGGDSTHCVLSAHRGLPSAELFSNLDKLEVGDTFTITVLNKVLTYEVDQITIVEPDQLENLYIVNGEDYCTLMTCTPYGVNTHRLLVRGKRIETEEAYSVNVIAEAYKVDTVLVEIVMAVLLLVILFIGMLIGTRKRNGDKKKQ